MPLKNGRYTYRVTWSEDDQEYAGLCTEFPSLSWLDKTPETALKGIREIVQGVIKDMSQTGEEIPQPIACKDTAVNLWSVSPLKFTEILPFRHRNQVSA